MTRLMIHALTSVLLSLALSAHARDLKVTVAAGDSDRTGTPVYVDLALAADQAKDPICVVAADKVQPAQIEPLDNGRARVWWIIDNLPAGQSRSYEIIPGKPARLSGSETFVWKESSQGKVKSKDLCFGDRPVVRYMYTPFDGTDKDTIDVTRKPYYHLFDPNGSRLITKGEGGKYPHHRGIFYGHNRVKIDGQDKTLDVWSAADAHQLHTRFVREFAGPVLGGHVVTVDWKDPQGNTFATETRRFLAFRTPADEILVQFDTTVATSDKAVDLTSSNNHHGGVQFRADQAVAEREQDTRFLRPGKWAALPTDKAIDVEDHPDFKDLPWNAIQYKLADRAYTVIYLCHPQNPRNAEFSERAYGRFGEYSTWRLTRDKPLSLSYRFWGVATHDLKPDRIDRQSADFINSPKVTPG